MLLIGVWDVVGGNHERGKARDDELTYLAWSSSVMTSRDKILGLVLGNGREVFGELVSTWPDGDYEGDENAD